MKKKAILIFSLVMTLGCVSNIERKENLGFVRNAHSMAYNALESKVYLFAGASEEEVVSDLWVLDSKNWRRVDTKIQPEPRTFASMVYDIQNNRLILFGGSKVLFGIKPDSNNLLNDTWQFKNNKWEKLITKNSPIPRAEASMVYDQDRETVVLFGGYHIQNNEYIKLGDTWEFRNNDWNLITNSGPSNRHGAAMAYDSEEKCIILFGGSTIDKQYGESKGETWKWDGKEWKKTTNIGPAGIFNASMAYDEERKEFIRFGGWNGTTRINETWRLSGNNWDKLKTNKSPNPRNHSNMIYDQKNGRMVLFGGHDGENVFGDIWEFRNYEWNKIMETSPIRRIENGH
ncbi:hypothetical protein C5O00_13820 [Pukyongia salina]|uniref:Galactose oxidase n=1 Tax=Pukyongia salina TaxID=2094025 RepID=A0A2S0HZT2_9FLAO|nr:kelch repeat-containing protein [Pukyongia salina]AVI52172.1 hypothetical protein C5O00_13820 [Pukyongia salina]